MNKRKKLKFAQKHHFLANFYYHEQLRTNEEHII
jgi:hypothetical protein